MALTINRQKHAAVETARFGASAAAGLAIGSATVKAGTALGITLLATPVGWLVLIGSALMLGYVTSKYGDMAGKAIANKAYNKSSNFSWF